MDTTSDIYHVIQININKNLLFLRKSKLQIQHKKENKKFRQSGDIHTP